MVRSHPEPQVDFILLLMRQKRFHLHWLDAVIHDFNDFNRTESSCCIRTYSDGGIRLNDLSLSIRLVLSPPDDFCRLSCRWCRSIFPSVHTFGSALSSPPLHLALLLVRTVFTHEMRTHAFGSVFLCLRILSDRSIRATLSDEGSSRLAAGRGCGGLRGQKVLGSILGV